MQSHRLAAAHTGAYPPMPGGGRRTAQEADVIQVIVKGGTHGGFRKPMAEGHGPRCVCARCETTRKEDTRGRQAV